VLTLETHGGEEIVGCLRRIKVARRDDLRDGGAGSLARVLEVVHGGGDVIRENDFARQEVGGFAKKIPAMNMMSLRKRDEEFVESLIKSPRFAQLA
jgi:hypothetical protein